jgi:hypothetical protein
MGDLIADLLADFIRDFVWKWLLRPVLTVLLVRPLRWLVIRPVQRHLARRRFRRDLQAHRRATVLPGG